MLNKMIQRRIIQRQIHSSTLTQVKINSVDLSPRIERFSSPHVTCEKAKTQIVPHGEMVSVRVLFLM